MFYTLQEFDITGFILNPDYREMKGETFLSEDTIDVEPFIGVLPEGIGYKLTLNWTAQVINHFNADIVLVAAGIQEIYFTPDDNRDLEMLKHAIAKSQNCFYSEVLKMLTNTPLQDIKFGDVDHGELAENAMEFATNNSM